MPAPIESHSLTWNVTPDLIGILDNSGVFIETNPAWQHTLGWTPEDILARTFFDFLHPDDVMANAKAFEEIKTGTPILNFENRYRHKNGTYRWLSWNAVPEGGNYFCSARDVTEAKMNAASLHSRDQEAVLREQFIAVLGHDLRNPLAAISSAMRLLRREDLSEHAETLLTAVDGSVDRMNALIADVMDFTRSKLGSGLQIAWAEAQDTVQLIAQAVDEIAMAHQDITIVREFTFEGMVRCDPQRIQQLASNLLGNAVSHGDRAHPITVRLFEKGDGDAASMVLSVTNAGPDIAESQITTIFDPFYTAEPDAHKKGLGLGLFIVSQIAKGHGGTMDVTSRDGETTFTFEMPLNADD